MTTLHNANFQVRSTDDPKNSDDDEFYHVGQGSRQNTVVILSHGFSGSPAELRFCANQLHQHGFTVHGLRLPGHGTTPEDLRAKTHTQWQLHMDGAVAEARKHGKTCVIVGQSMGGLLALHAAAKYTNVKGVCVAAVPWKLAAKSAYWLIPSLHLLHRLFPSFFDYTTKSTRDMLAPELIQTPTYDRMPTDGVYELLQVIEKTGRLLTRQEWNIPVLQLHGRHDHTATLDGAKEFFGRLRTSAKEIVILENTGHVVLADQERERAAREIISWIDDRVLCC